MKELPPSIAEKEFIRLCETQGSRHDGRNVDQFRPLEVRKLDENNYLATLGETKIATSVQAVPFKPSSGRQNRGELSVQMVYMPCAAKAALDLQINRMKMRNEDALQTLLRAANVIDGRFLLIEQYEAALHIIVRVQVINDAGGILDAAMAASVVALSNYKVPKYKFVEGVFKKISTDDEWPDQLRIFSHAYVITFALFGKTFVADPDDRESLYADGFVRIGCTEKNMVFAIREDGESVQLTKEVVMRLCDIAQLRAKALDSDLQTFFKDTKGLSSM
uniref:RNase_PH domain-containing protein n=1 Tax=Panagrellus redivivus TaxID=6233 RepID=A0A7E4VW37_PANRE